MSSLFMLLINVLLLCCRLEDEFRALPGACAAVWSVSVVQSGFDAELVGQPGGQLDVAGSGDERRDVVASGQGVVVDVAAGQDGVAVVLGQVVVGGPALQIELGVGRIVSVHDPGQLGIAGVAVAEAGKEARPQQHGDNAAVGEHRGGVGSDVAHPERRRQGEDARHVPGPDAGRVRADVRADGGQNDDVHAEQAQHGGVGERAEVEEQRHGEQRLDGGQRAADGALGGEAERVADAERAAQAQAQQRAEEAGPLVVEADVLLLRAAVQVHEEKSQLHVPQVELRLRRGQQAQRQEDQLRRLHELVDGQPEEHPDKVHQHAAGQQRAARALRLDEHQRQIERAQRAHLRHEQRPRHGQRQKERPHERQRRHVRQQPVPPPPEDRIAEQHCGQRSEHHAEAGNVDSVQHRRASERQVIFP